MYRQKGTGNARAGHRTSGVRRGGGHIFAKAPRNFYYRLPAKAIRKATRMAIASKINDNEIVVVDGLSLESPKTKEITGLMSNLKPCGKKCFDHHSRERHEHLQECSQYPASGCLHAGQPECP